MWTVLVVGSGMTSLGRWLVFAFVCVGLYVLIGKVERVVLSTEEEPPVTPVEAPTTIPKEEELPRAKYDIVCHSGGTPVYRGQAIDFYWNTSGTRIEITERDTRKVYVSGDCVIHDKVQGR